MLKKVFLLIFVFIVAFLAGVGLLKVAYAGTLSCTIRTSACSGGETEIFEMQNTTNSHAGLPSASYNNLVCCSGVTDLGNSCSGTFATVLKLSGTTNAHIQQTGSYAQSACIQAPSGGSVSIGYQSTNCSGFDTTLASMSGASNAHVGNTTAYTTKICATAAAAAPVYSVSITSSGVVEYGFVELSTASSTVGNGYTQTAKNDGNTTEKLNVKSSNATGGTTWTLAEAIETNQYKHEFSTTTGSRWDVMPDSDTYVTAHHTVVVDGTVDFDFRLTTPSASADYQQKSITITVQAVAP